MLIWTPADGRRGTATNETDPHTDGFAETASAEATGETPCGPTRADVFMVKQRESSNDAHKSEDDAWCAVDRPAENKVRVKIPS